MKRAFIVTSESKYYKDMEEYIKISEEQKNFVKMFFKKNNIETKKFAVRGEGLCNKIFTEYSMRDIYLTIVPTENDRVNFSKQLTKIDADGICRFRQNSKILKDFQKQCVDQKVIINILSPNIRDSFTSMSWFKGYGFTRLKVDDKYYVEINSDELSSIELPKGFEEIKLSEFYRVVEEHKK